MGWMCVAVLTPLRGGVPDGAMKWLVARDVVYTVGVVVFASQRPRLGPGKFSSHELWRWMVGKQVRASRDQCSKATAAV
jgi:channel protein (hemolysin III family)